MISLVAYGTENGKDYYVQTISKEHNSKEYSDVMTKKQARQVAKKISKLFSVPVIKC